ncbi:unnamed protein product [Linum tenue]|uniref:Uncharacterized protein n=1 Tax=Linum tenue TaxID=586396 RepID=A0AAV0H1D9_9ROSI|nr:unnamed protein product [Linum tenue]
MDKPLRAWTAQTCHSFINFLEPSSLFYIALLSSLAATMILWYGFSPILVSIPVLLLSTIFISSIFSKRKVVTAAAELCVAEKTDNEACELHEYQVDSTEFPSDDESSSDDSLRSEIFELKWMKPFNNNVGQSLAFCESSASDYDELEDDDDLIEISLPPNESSVYVDEVSSIGMLSWEEEEEEEEEEGMMEVVEEIDEVNEEDNLIEIDLSIGSIKFPSFDMEG